MTRQTSKQAVGNEICQTISSAPRPDRRSWLRSTATLATSAWVGGVASGVISSTDTHWGSTPAARAIERIRRQQPYFKLSLAAYSYRRLLNAKTNPLTLFDFVDDCAQFNLHGTELTSYYFPEQLDDHYLHQLSRHCFRQGLDISGTAVGNDFGHPEGSKRHAEIEGVKRWIRRAAVLGAPVIRIFAGKQHGQSAKETHRLIVTGIQECCEYAGEHGVHLALENHGGPTATAEGLLALVRDIESPWFGVNLDTGNFHSSDIYGELAKAAPYALNVQVKASVSGPDRQKSKADFGKIAKILRDVNYRGYVALEFEDAGDPRTECPRLLAELRDALYQEGVQEPAAGDNK